MEWIVGGWISGDGGVFPLLTLTSREHFIHLFQHNMDTFYHLLILLLFFLISVFCVLSGTDVNWRLRVRQMGMMESVEKTEKEKRKRERIQRVERGRVN